MDVVNWEFLIDAGSIISRMDGWVLFWNELLHNEFTLFLLLCHFFNSIFRDSLKILDPRFNILWGFVGIIWNASNQLLKCFYWFWSLDFSKLRWTSSEIIETRPMNHIFIWSVPFSNQFWTISKSFLKITYWSEAVVALLMQISIVPQHSRRALTWYYLKARRIERYGKIW